jgi:pimeloyl-ACP methyl ester carboxylesterase
MALTMKALLRGLKWLGLGLVGLAVAALLAGSGYEAYARRAARRDHPPRGVLVDVGGRRLHLDCRGHGRPVVVLEAGLDTAGSLAWSAVHDRIAATTRTCAYDRAGILWSDPRTGPTDADAVVADLHAALGAAGEPAPYVFAAHSLGGPLVMDYARHYPDQVAGVVFVDASHPDQLARFAAAGVPVSMPLGLFRTIVALRWTGLGRLPFLADTPDRMPADAAATARAFGLDSGPAALAEMEALPTILSQAGRLRTLGDRPLHVLTARKPPPDRDLRLAGLTRAQAERLRSIWKDLQDDEARWSTDARHDLVDDASHYVQYDRPDLVIGAVEDVVTRVRAKAAARPAT